MKSIKRRFKKISRKNPYLSSVNCFTQAIYEMGFSRQSIHRWFNKLVPRDDYAKEDKKQVMAFLESIRKCPRTTKKETILTLEK